MQIKGLRHRKRQRRSTSLRVQSRRSKARRKGDSFGLSLHYDQQVRHLRDPSTSPFRALLNQVAKYGGILENGRDLELSGGAAYEDSSGVGVAGEEQANCSSFIQVQILIFFSLQDKSIEIIIKMQASDYGLTSRLVKLKDLQVRPKSQHRSSSLTHNDSLRKEPSTKPSLVARRSMQASTAG